ncbi:MAG TPA: GyrI-like domain-containing protein [Gemmatimonadaceae bacterium]|nr:GyrI-like domain-containing protein [Gemmatimonadaceae bacterium]
MAVTLKTVPPATFVMSTHDGVTIPEISAVSRGVVDDMIAELHARGIAPLAPVHFIYHGADGSLTTKFRLTIAFPIAKRPAAPIEEYEVAELPAFRCMAADYVGPMPDIQIAYNEILDAIRESGRSRSPESREIYKKWIGYESPDNVTELQVGVA